jgi:amino acid adenylation domain-containing protein/non-ribosomal peptide synthase protein (TIGR01720 family)
MKNIEDIYGLSSMQQGMLFHSISHRRADLYFKQLTWGISGELHPVAYQKAWEDLVARHPILRTAFVWEAAEGPLQVVHQKVRVPFESLDLRALAPDAQEREVRRFLEADRERGFDLSKAPLLRLALIRLGEDSYRAVWSHHHLIMDGWSLPLLFKEVFALYHARTLGKEVRLPLLRPFGDYIQWLESQDPARAEAFWRKNLAGFTAPTPFRVDRSGVERGPAGGFSDYEEKSLLLTEKATAALQAFGRQHQLTLNTLVQGAWAILLSHYSGEQDIIFGTTVSGRSAPLPGIDQMLGVFINTLPLRTEVPKESTVLRFLRALQDRHAEIREYEYTPFAEVQGYGEVPRGLPLFESIIVFENYPLDRSTVSPKTGIGVRDLKSVVRNNFPITLLCAPAQQLPFRLAYDKRRFEGEAMDRLLAHLETLFEAIPASPHRLIKDLPYLTAREQQDLLVDWNQTAADYPREALIHELFEAWAEKTPEATALQFEERGLSYHELNRRANRLAHYLRKQGVGPDTIVAISLPSSLETVLGLLAVLKAGGAYVPLDPELPRERLLHMVQDTQARVVLTQPIWSPLFEGSGAEVLSLTNGAEHWAHESDENPARLGSSANLCYVLFTSGSTGRPKGVSIEHRQLVNYTRGVQRRLHLGPGASYALVSTFSADLGNTVVYPSLTGGGCLHVVSHERTMDPDALAEYFDRHRVDCLKIVPSHLSALLAGAHPERVIPRKVLVLGGEASSWELIQKIHTLSPDCTILNHYGPTETTVGVLTYPVEKGRRDPRTPIVPLGRPLDNSRVYLLDSAMKPVPVGVPGEVYIGGEGVARGYLNRAELTAERFLPDPFAPGSRLYRTGDQARYLADGNLVFLGRIDLQVKIRGFRIELGEIEAALGEHPSVRESVVLAEEEPSGTKRLVAFVVARAEASVAPAELKGFLEGRLPDYMVPSAITALAAIPLTPNGKIDRRALAELGQKDDERVEVEQSPRNPIEEVLESIWADVFGREQVGVHENFNDLGGHSLLAIQIVARTRDAFQTELPLRAIFEAPTIAGLAAQVEASLREDAGLEAPPITRVPRERPLQLSFAQERLWFLAQLEPNSLFYNVSIGLRLGGRLDAGALEKALREIVRRHEVLRTTFAAPEGQPVQIVQPEAPVPLPIDDFSALAPQERDAAARAQVDLEAKRPFDLATGPLFRPRLIRLSVDDHVLLISMHHIVSDAWTRGILNREISLLYGAFSRGEPSPLPELPIQYADYAEWQRSWLRGEALDRQLAYWKQQLTGAPALLELPIDRPRPPVMSHRGAMRTFSLPGEIHKALLELSRREGVTLFMTLLAGFTVLLHRYSAQDDISVGTPMLNRTKVEAEGLIGFFVNTLVIRTPLTGELSFQEALAKVRETCLAAYAHQDMPFERLVQELEPERDLSRTPLFQAMFTFQNAAKDTMTLPGLTLRTGGLESGTTKFDLTLSMGEGQKGLSGYFEYSTDLFDPSTIERMIGHLGRLFAGIGKDAGTKVGELPMLTDEERYRQIVEWNSTAGAFPGDSCAHEPVERQAALTPDAVAVTFEGQTLSYRELNERANRLAHHLRRFGVGPDVPVGISVQRSFDLIVGVLAIHKAGGPYLSLDPEYPRERLTFMVEDTRAPVILSQSALADTLPPSEARVIFLDTGWGEIANEPCDNLPRNGLTADHLAYLIYTSGSTGKPKGVAMGHRALANLIAYQNSGGPGNVRTLQFASASFDVFFQETYATLGAGGVLVLVSEEGRRDSERLLRLMADERVERLFIPPVALQQLAEIEAPDAHFPIGLREIMSGGEALQITPKVMAFIERMPGCVMRHHYGPSENHLTCELVMRGSPRAWPALPPIGHPIRNVRTHIVDARFQPVAVGVPGELCIGGVQLARGYLNRPELTDERFVPDPFAREIEAATGPIEPLPTDSPLRPPPRLYRTGDRVRYRANGEIDFLGRIDNQVKIRGFRVELGEIEAVLNKHPLVKESFVMLRQDSAGDKRLVAYLGRKEGTPPAISELRSFLKATLPEYMVPQAFVLMDALPVAGTGKVDHRALPAPDAAAQGERATVAPRGPVEEALAGIFADVLKLAVEAVGAHDGFFELGGHSLLATQVVSRIRAAFGIELPLRGLFEAPTVAELGKRVSALLEAGRGVSIPSVTRVPREGNLLLSFGQERLWFLAQLDPNDPSYIIPLAVRMEGALDREALRRAIDAIVARHEVLRTTFRAVEGRPVQILRDDLRVPLEIASLREVPEGAREAEVRRIGGEIRRPFDLEQGPLFRARLVELDADDHILFLSMHHIVSDAWTMGVLRKEIGAYYRAFSAEGAGRGVDLPELTLQFADYAAWQRAWLQGEALDQQLSYWTTRLHGAPAALDVPADRPRPPVPSHRGAKKSFSIPAELGKSLRDLSRKEGVTLFMTLLAAFDVLLYRYTGQTDLMVGSPIANRTRGETEDLIGFFTNTIVFRAELDPEQSFSALLQTVKETCLGAYAHQDMPFERLVQEISPGRDLSRTPLFQVAISYQSASRDGSSLPGLTLRPVGGESSSAKFDLLLGVLEGQSALSAIFEYTTDLFEGSTIDRMIGHFRALLEGIVQHPEKKLWELPLLGDEELQRLLAPSTAVAPPGNVLIHEIFEAQVDRHPERTALTFEGKSLTYRELDERSNRLAHRLRALGVGPDVLVGLCVQRSLEMVVGILGILKAGGAYLPLDPEYPRDRLAFMVQDADVPVLVTQDQYSVMLAAQGAAVLRLDVDWPSVATEPATRLPRINNPQHLAYVIYTSGSTGKPKGVLIPHANVVRLFSATDHWFGFDEQDVWTLFHSYAFDFTVWELWGALFHGGRLVVVPYWISRSPEAFYKLLCDEGVTVLNQTPSAFRQLIHAEGTTDRSALRELALRWVVFGGEALDLGDLRPWWDRHSDQKPVLVNMYGITETTVHVTYRPVSRADLERPWSSVIGHPIPDLRIFVLDTHRGLLPIGVPGEMFVGGAGVARGYLGRPELTAERFLADPFSSDPAARLYRTGDLARQLASGDLEYLGRIDHQVKIRGHRIETGEIEAALDLHPGVREAVVIPREYGPSDRRLVAYLVAEDEPGPSAAELRAFLKEKLPEYMIPAAFVSLLAMPINENGKVDRKALPAPESAGTADEQGFVAPRGPIEEALAEIFAEVLKAPEVSAHASFFELGGHSLLATQAIARIRGALGVELPLRALFEASTVSELGARVEAALRAGQGIETPPLVRAARGETAPLSFAQERLWFLAELDPNDPSYLVPLVQRLEGDLDISALEKAIAAVLERHEVLRTTFSMVDGQPVARLRPAGEISLPVTRFPELARDQREAEVRRAAGLEARLPIDLATGPMLRAHLYELDPQDHVLLLTMHHIVSDGWTMGILNREVAALYGAFATGEAPALPELPIQYADYAAWQRQWMRGEPLERQLAYWRAQLQGAPAAMDLPADRPRPPVPSRRGARKGFTVPAGVSESLRALSQREGTTLFMTLLAAFDVLLHRYTRQGDVVVGSPIANRTRAETERLIGFFVNTLVLRTELADDLGFKDLLQRVKEVCLGAYAHQDMPFERLVSELSPERDPSRTPLFQVMFILQNAPQESLALPGLKLRGMSAEGVTVKFDLMLTLMDHPGGIRGTFEFASDLFDLPTIERMVTHFQTVLDGIARDPDRTVSELPLLPQEEAQRLLVDWNATQVAYPPETLLHQLFEAQVERSPEAVALSFEGETLSYRALDEQANRLARRLQALGVGPDVLVGVCLSRSLALPMALLAVLKAGGAYVPLDTSYPKERLDFMIEDAEARVLLTEQSVVSSLPAGTATVLALDDLDLSAEVPTAPACAATPESLAYVLFTSGSTGKPKGAMIPHRAIVNHMRWMQGEFPLGEGDAVLQKTPVSFDASVWEFYAPLMAGARLVMAIPDGHRDAAYLIQALIDERITTLQLVPSLLELLLLTPGLEHCTSLKRLFCGGEALHRSLVERFWERLPAPQVVNLYGPTEVTIDSVFHVSGRQASGAVMEPIGRPIANLSALVLDRAMKLCPIGVPGELHLGGAGVGRGYLHRPDLSAERFVQSPFGEGRIYKTGDLVRRLASGVIEYLGRIDSQVKLRGHRIELGEIESVLGQHPSVQETAVLVREDRQGDVRLVAYLVLAAGARSAGDLRAFCKDKLPDYMVPSAYVTLESFPHLASGKVDRRALPAPEAGAVGERVYIAPRGPVEEGLASIFAEVLQVDLVGAHDGFFALGGHSLLATSAIARIRAAFGVELPLRALFEASTPAELAPRVTAALLREQGIELPPLEPAPRDGALPLSFGQGRLWFLSQLDPGDTSYLVPLVLRLQGDLDPVALRRALDEIVRRHEVLRTTFVSVDGEPVQIIHAPRTLDLPEVDLRGLPEAEREGAFRREAASEARLPIDLVAGPPLRARLVTLSDDDHALLLTMHHIVSDGWSQGVLRRELSALYEAFHQDLPSPLPELAIQYADYAAWQRRVLQGATLESQLAYWKDRLRGAASALELPTDRPRPAVRSHRGAARAVSYPLALAQGLSALSRKEGVTLFMALLAAFDLLLHRWSGQGDIVVGTSIANRTMAETEKLIGFFVNTLVLRASVSPELSFRALLQQVKEVCLGAYAHQDMPFEELVKELEPERDLSRTPLFQVSFVMQNAPREAMRMEGLRLRGGSGESSTAKFDLTLSLGETRNGLLGTLEYNSDLFDASTIDRLGQSLGILLQAIVESPDAQVGDLSILPEAERQQVVVAWNDTAHPLPEGICIPDWIDAQIARTPDALAVSFEGEMLSYRALDLRARRLARHLQSLGVGANVPVGLCVERSLEMIVAILAILKAGGAYVPLDPAWPKERIARILEGGRISLVLAQQRLSGLLEGSAVRVLHLDGELPSGEGEPERRATPDTLAYVIYTSGSTGEPKGVAVHHRNLLHSTLARLDYYKKPVGRFLLVSSFAFDSSIAGIFWTLCQGGTIVLPSPSFQEEPEQLVALIPARGITHLLCVPTLYAFLLDRLGEGEPSPLEVVIVAGEAVPVGLAIRHHQRLPEVALFNEYGPTEATVWCSVYETRPGETLPRMPIGKPISNTQLYILDERRAPVPIGVAGEIYVGGAGVTAGYLNLPAATAEKFVESPFGPKGARLYRTGDLGRFLPDGNIDFLGRADHQVKIRGYRIELGEIESVLGGHPGVREAVVLAREGSAGEMRLVAYLVSSDGGAPSTAELRAFLDARLPAYMVPRAFVRLEQMPLTPNGKVDRRALPDPDSAALGDGAQVAPRGPVEEALAGIFGEILKTTGVSAHDNFFDLGGHSLLATRVIARVRAAFGVELGVQGFFEAPTVAGLGARVEAALRGERGIEALPLVRVPRGGPMPLSSGQERLWFLDQLDPGDISYLVPVAMRFEGELDRPALDRALQAIVDRHEALRTTFSAEGGKPAQIIHDRLDFHLLVRDLQALGEGDREAAVRREMAEEATLPFELGKGPLIRGRLLLLGVADHALLLTMHHIVSDAWAQSILNREVAALYSAFRRGEPSPLPELPIQYADYAAWQRKWLDDEVLSSQLTYWRKQLDGAPRAIDLPTDRIRPPVRSSRGERKTVFIPPPLLERLHDLGRREGVTLFMMLLAALDVVLYRYTGQSDIVVGSPIAGRTRAETEELIGFFLNTLVLRVSLSDDLTFEDLLRRVKEVCLGAYAHQDMPFERLVQELAPERDMSRSPLFQVILNLQNTPKESAGVEGLKLRRMGVDAVSTKADLTLIMAEGPTGLTGMLAYSTDIFEGATIERLLRQLVTLLEGVVEDPTRRLRDLPLLPAEEQTKLLVEWNSTAVAYAKDTLVHQLFEARADEAPDAPALVAGGVTLSFGELDRSANRLAHRLRSMGVGRGAVVGLCLDRSAALIVGLLGILKAGAAYVPLDVAYPRQRLSQILDEAGVRIVVSESAFAPLFAEGGVSVLRLDADAVSIASESEERLHGGASAEDLCYVLFTSGSTGKPKGVAIEHRQLVNYVHGVAERMGLPRGASYAHVSTFAADLGNTVLFPPLCLGGCLHVISQGLTTDPAGMAAYFDEHGIDCLKIVPSHLAALLAAPHPERLIPRKLLVLGGEASSWELIARIEKLRPDCRILNHYGPTETTVGVLTFPVEPGKRTMGAPIVPLGRPLPNSRVYILDPSLRPVPTGAPGELVIGGAGVARGYLNRPDLTAERFLADPFSNEPGARMYRTGDRARLLPDGSLLFLGRIDFQVKIRGYRVELGEIEATLAAHPRVGEAVVLALSAEGSSDKLLVGYAVSHGDPAPTAAELQSFLGERLPEYMVPASLLLLPALPLTPNGKIDRQALSLLAQAPPDDEGQDFAGPRTPVEEVLSAIWCDVFGKAEIGIHESFNDLGGHSLLAIQIIARARDAFQAPLALRAIFESPTIAALAEQVEAAMREGEGLEAPPIVRAPREGLLPLSFAQERLWFLDQMDPNNPFYNVPSGIRFQGRFDAEAMEQALREIVRRHEVLRTTFTTVEGKPSQLIHAEIALRLPILDLSTLPEAERAAAVQREAAAEAQLPFDLATGPLFRARLLRAGEEDHVLLLTMHHIVSDAWTRGLLRKELGRLYAAFAAGRPSPLPELPIQYADYAVWQRQWLTGEVLDKQLAYWKTQLEGAPEALSLPTDHPRPREQSHRGSERFFKLSTPLSQALGELSRREGSTLFMTLLAAFQLLLHRYSGQDDVVVGSPVLNRTRPETEGLIGFFLNTLVLRTQITEELTFQELLARVRDICLGAYGHQDIPFERLVTELAPERDLGRSPFFQVTFTLQNAPIEQSRLSGVKTASVNAETTTAKFDLSLGMASGPGGMGGSIEYATDLFEAATIERMIEHLRILLEAIVAAPDRPIAELAWFSEAERQTVLVDWNRSENAYPHGTLLHELFESQAARTPDGTALVFEGRELSYREVEERANRLARRLQTLGAASGSLVGVCLPRSLDLPVALLAVLKAGAAYVPIDPTYPRERIAQMLEDSRATVLLGESVFLASLPGEGVTRLALDTLDLGAEDPSRPTSVAGPESLAYVLFTSGSTGRPKGAMIPHRAIVNHMRWMHEAFPLGPDDAVLQKTPISFDASVWEFYAPLMAGARLVLARPEGHREPAYLAQAVIEQRITVLQLVPSMAELLVHERAIERATSLKRLFCGGEALSRALVERFWERLPALEIVNLYGPTEVTIDSVYHRCERQGSSAAMEPIGRPIANVQAYVLDARLTPVPAGIAGELYLGGAGVGLGYLRRPDLSAERFAPSPFGEGLLYRTGDSARWLPDGTLAYLGRVDQQVKIRGFRIELGEIESVLGSHPSVRECAALAREDVPGEKKLVGYLVFVEGASPTAGEIRAFLKEKLPEYMLPSAFVVLPALPLLASGKVDRRALPAPEGGAGLGRVYAPPRDEAEATLAKIWATLLRIPRVGVHDNFFEIGGDSILSIQIVARAQQAGLGITPRQIFLHPTIAELAAVAGTAEAVSAEQGPVVGPVPLLPIQRRFLALDVADPAHWNQATLLAAREPLEEALVEEVVTALIEHHDALRLRVNEGPAGFEQVLAPPGGSVPFRFVDLSSLPEISRREVLEKAAAEAQRSLHLGEGPLLRVILFDLGPEQGQRLLIVVHHLAIDGVSWRILLDDLWTGYQQRRRGEAIALPAKTTSFKRWAERLSEYARSEAIEAEAAYWLAEPRRRVSPLPVDKSEGENLESSAKTVVISLSADETEALLRRVPEAYRTQINDVLLTAYAQAMEAWTGAPITLVDLEGHGREELFGDIDLTRTVGWFTALYPVLLELPQGLDAGAPLRAVKEQIRAIPGRGLGHGLLRWMRDDARSAEIAALPAAEVSFNYLGQVDQALPEASPLRGARESAGPTHSPRALRGHLLDVNASVLTGRLVVRWTYSENRHERSTIEALADSFAKALRALIDHCLSPGAGGATPSDFQEENLTQDLIDMVASLDPSAGGDAGD